MPVTKNECTVPLATKMGAIEKGTAKWVDVYETLASGKEVMAYCKTGIIDRQETGADNKEIRANRKEIVTDRKEISAYRKEMGGCNKARPIRNDELTPRGMECSIFGGKSIILIKSVL